MPKKNRTRPSLTNGLLIGALLTAALIAVFYLTAQAVGTPFAPFDVFDWIGRVMPGPVITFGIDQIVNMITTFQLGELSSAAKTAEQLLAILGMFVTGTVVAGVLFGWLRGSQIQSALLPGLIAGLLIGAPVMFISAQVNQTAVTGSFISALWIVAGYAVWGLVLGWIWDRLAAPAAEGMPEIAALEQIDRRRFLVTVGGATAAITVVGTGLGVLIGRGKPQPEAGVALNTTPWSASNSLPNANDALVPAPGTRPEFTPVGSHYRIDINTLPPVIKENEWRLTFAGLVDEPVQFTLADLRENYEPMHQFITLACISNRIAGELIGTQRWTGVSLKTLLADVPLKPEATHLKITAADNFDEFIDLETVMNDDRVMLCYDWDDQPLTASHGFPLRIYIPNHYGMKQPKWITGIEVLDHWEEGWWVRRGWDIHAIMRATSVIDTVAIEALLGDNASNLLPIGGIAHAGDRGISKVEVRIDDGEWTQAQLRSPLSETTWVIWRYDWPFEAGEHTFAVRCFEGDGTEQISRVEGTRPSGATGIHEIDRSISL